MHQTSVNTPNFKRKRQCANRQTFQRMNKIKNANEQMCFSMYARVCILFEYLHFHSCGKWQIKLNLSVVFCFHSPKVFYFFLIFY